MYFLTTHSSKGACSQPYECRRCCRRFLNKEKTEKKEFPIMECTYIVGHIDVYHDCQLISFECHQIKN